MVYGAAVFFCFLFSFVVLFVFPSLCIITPLLSPWPVALVHSKRESRMELQNVLYSIPAKQFARDHICAMGARAKPNQPTSYSCSLHFAKLHRFGPFSHQLDHFSKRIVTFARKSINTHIHNELRQTLSSYLGPRRRTNIHVLHSNLNRIR